VQQYLALHDDATAEAFIEAFWARRDPDPNRPGNPVRELFEERARDADRRFSEAGYLGRRTARGTMLVLYGEPKKIDFEVNGRPEQPPVEHWIYAPEAAKGLDGRQPPPAVRFVKRGDLTVLYQQPPSPRPSLLAPAPRP
jgi:GWxTD domain-containing protein